MNGLVSNNIVNRMIRNCEMEILFQNIDNFKDFFIIFIIIKKCVLSKRVMIGLYIDKLLKTRYVIFRIAHIIGT